MSRIIVAAELPTASSEARDEVIEALTKVSVFSKQHEQGVLNYMICVPTDTSDTTTVWAIEVYADKAALDAHMASDATKELISFMSTKSVLSGAPTIRQLSFLNDLDFVKPSAADQKDPLIVFADIQFSSGERDGTLKYWKQNLESSKEESGCFVYGFAHDEAKPDTLYTLEVYVSEKYLWDVHIKAPAVQETIEKTKDLRTEMKLAKLQLKGGYVAKAA
ncbi:uncharacterized protein LTR77_000237 [Saxophila tyrrhenica]|uniref:ABM domain-containing protein n=1 Tax=Saxophila tyrrhenica TaxID=1690608 RepID=A0AAV9PRY0_9PEZI|nr:hypothetical protein LTR77_000237 [Saxophila tyrrhenica]